MDPVGKLIKGIQQASRTSSRWKVEFSKAAADLEGNTRSVLDRHMQNVMKEKLKIWRTEKELQSVGSVVDDKTYTKCMRLYGTLESQAQKVIGELDAFDRSISKEKLDRDRAFLSLQRKSNEIRKGMEELRSSSRKSSNALKNWWKDMNKDGTTGIPLDPKVTDIMAKTKKNQTIAMPPRQPFKGLVKYENVPEFIETEFRTLASKSLQANVDAGLKDVRSLVAKKVETFNDQFNVADQKSDEKRAKALFDNFNHFLQNDLSKDLEKVVEEAAEASLVEAVGKLTTFKTAFKNRGTKVGKISVDTSGFFSVEVVMSKQDPGAEITAAFDDASKSLQKHYSAYQSAVDAIQKSLTSLEQAFGELDREVDRLLKDINGVQPGDEFKEALKEGSSKREKLLETIGGEVRNVSGNFDKIRAASGKLSNLLGEIGNEVKKEAEARKDNAKVSKRSVEDFRTALYSLYTAFSNASDAVGPPQIDWQYRRPAIEKALVASRARREFESGEELTPLLPQHKKTLANWQRNVTATTNNVKKKLIVSKQFTTLEKAAAKLGK